MKLVTLIIILDLILFQWLVIKTCWVSARTEFILLGYQQQYISQDLFKSYRRVSSSSAEYHRTATNHCDCSLYVLLLSSHQPPILYLLPQAINLHFPGHVLRLIFERGHIYKYQRTVVPASMSYSTNLFCNVALYCYSHFNYISPLGTNMLEITTS